MHLTKHHGLGNDFLVTFVDEIPSDAPEIARDLCDRRTGIGADGLILGIDNGSNVVMRLFNSDGSTAEVSGNGLRCFVQAVAMRRGVQHLETDIDTLAGLRACVVEPTDDTAIVFASVDMGPVTSGDAPDTNSFLDRIDGLTGVRRWATGAVGNPHVVIEIADPGSVALEIAGPQVEQFFPHGVNVHFVAARGADQIELKVWERGAGVTLACGSGATVAAQRMYEWGRVGERATVMMPGGSAVVDVISGQRDTAVLSGTATFVGAVQVPRG